MPSNFGGGNARQGAKTRNQNAARRDTMDPSVSPHCQKNGPLKAPVARPRRTLNLARDTKITGKHYPAPQRTGPVVPATPEKSVPDALLAVGGICR